MCEQLELAKGKTKTEKQCIPLSSKIRNQKRIENRALLKAGHTHTHTQLSITVAVDGESLSFFLPTNSAENFYDNISHPGRESLTPTCSSPPKMDDFPWQQVKSGDLVSLQVLISSSSTSRRVRALQELRDKAGTTDSQVE